jgi:hypothetical protein
VFRPLIISCRCASTSFADWMATLSQKVLVFLALHRREWYAKSNAPWAMDVKRLSASKSKISYNCEFRSLRVFLFGVLTFALL